MSDTTPHTTQIGTIVESAGDRPLVVVGVDGSQDGLRAVRSGVGVCHTTDTDLLLVHAVDDAMLAGAWGVAYDPEVLQEAGTAANQQALELALELGMPKDRVRAEVVLGSPGGVLARLSEIAELVIVGRRSVGGLERMFVGSTSVAVVSGAKCPVMVISAAAHPGEVGSRKLIGVGMNTSPGNHVTLEEGFKRASKLGCNLEIIHALQPAVGFLAPRVSPSDLDEQLNYIQGGLEALARKCAVEYPDVKYEVVVTADSPINELVSRSERFDLLVVGSSDSRLPGLGLGGLLRGLMAHAECPIYITP